MIVLILVPNLVDFSFVKVVMDTVYALYLKMRSSLVAQSVKSDCNAEDGFDL